MSLIATIAVNVRADTSKYRKGLKRARTATQSFVAGISAATGALKAMAMTFAPLVGAAGVFALVRGVESMNQKLNAAAAVAGGLADGEMMRLREAAIEVGKITKFSGGEAAEGLRFLMAAGLDSAAAVEALPVAAKFAQASLLDLGDATDRLVIAVSAMGLESKDAGEQMAAMKRVSDVLAKGSTMAATTVGDISDALNVSAGSARLAGMGLEETVGTLIALQKRGIRGVNAGTVLNQMLNQLAKSATKNADVFEELGIAVVDNDDKFRGASALLKDFEQAFRGKGFTEASKTLQDMGIPVKAMQGFKSLLEAGGEIQGFTTRLEDAGGAMEKMADQQLTPLQSGWANLKAAIEGVAAPIITPMIAAMGNAFTKMGDGLRWFVDNWRTGWELVKVSAKMALQAVGRFVPAVLSTMFDHFAVMGGNWSAIWGDMKAVTFASMAAIGRFVVDAFEQIGKQIKGQAGATISAWSAGIEAGLKGRDPLKAMGAAFQRAHNDLESFDFGIFGRAGRAAAQEFDSTFAALTTGKFQEIGDDLTGALNEALEAVDPGLVAKQGELLRALAGEKPEIEKAVEAMGLAAVSPMFRHLGKWLTDAVNMAPKAGAAPGAIARQVADPGAAGGILAGSQEFFSLLAARERGPTRSVVERATEATAKNTERANGYLRDIRDSQRTTDARVVEIL